MEVDFAAKDSVLQLCCICQVSQYKYRCPGCAVVTCSLSCVKQHKANTGCLGVRTPSEFVPLKQMTDQTLIRDFALLENTQTAVTRPVKSDNCSLSYSQKRAALKKLCYERGIWLKTMPTVFVRAKINTSHVRKRTELWWRVEWHFPSIQSTVSDHLILTDSFVDETIPVGDLVNRFLDNSWKVAPVKHQLVAL